MSAVGNPVVGPCGDHHSDDTTDDGHDCSDEESNSGPESLLGEEGDDEEHDSDEDEADEVLRPEELLGSLHQ